MAYPRDQFEDDDEEESDDERDDPLASDVDDDPDDPSLAPCPYCGKLIYDWADRCRHCGSFVSFDAPPAYRPFLVGGVIAGIIAVLYWVVRYV